MPNCKSDFEKDLEASVGTVGKDFVPSRKANTVTLPSVLFSQLMLMSGDFFVTELSIVFSE